ncbi:CPBP family intramembrane glutamic endopeptidase [Nocardia iowensis]|uniref:CPBP family intramembrane metalloprotease n=1 Tax=Nocardia iowensis TaxID=204891 RepID=A0ABX8RJW3_NOCIO|nr:CPBP family intramembrane glutamic endopeptidase [Nocardia iowensis]QXN89277.1 CPBP family intramembrane metalloprotease [Nocardia iowensis]
MRLGRTDGLLLTAGVLAFVAAMVTLIWTGHTALRFSADDESTLPLWVIGLTVFGGLAVAWLVPPKPRDDVLPTADTRATTRQAWWLVALGLAFAITYYLSPGGDLWFIGLKLLLLLAIPLLFRLVAWPEWYRVDTNGRWLRPLPAVLTFLALFTLFGHDYTGSRPDPVAVLSVFVLNAVLEEIFYRVWLQTRLEAIYGRWPAIVLASLLWACWHVAIHGGNGFGIDLATTIVHIGGYGLFLGYLWSRYRNPWLLILVHGIINAPLPMLAALW